MANSDEGNWSLTCTLRDWESLHSQLLFAFDERIPAKTADGTYSRLGEYSAWLVREGSAHVECDGEERTVGAGQWLICTGRKVQQRLSPDIRLLSLRMAGRWPNDDFLFGGPPLTLLKAADYPHLEPLAARLLVDVGHVGSRPENPSYTFLWRHRLDYLAYCRYQRHLLEWFEAIAVVMQSAGITVQIPRGIDHRLAAALFVIDKLDARAPFPGDQLAAIGGPTLGQLNRMCLRTYNVTMYGYWEQRRLERAKLLLGSPGHTVKEVAYQLGFSQLSHFSTWFKRHTSQSPRAYHAAQNV